MKTIKEPIKIGDLFLIYGDEPCILLVTAMLPSLLSPKTHESITSAETPEASPRIRVSSIFVQKVPYAPTPQKSHYTIDGSRVYYTPGDDDATEKQSECLIAYTQSEKAGMIVNPLAR